MKAVEILSKHNLKRTSCREGILNAVINANQALSENEIRQSLEGNYDRTTFYRSFKILEENKILHKIVVDNQLVKYALDIRESNIEEHAHFFCEKCNSVKCMKNVPVKKYDLPDGYFYYQTEVLIKGLCSECKKDMECGEYTMVYESE